MVGFDDAIAIAAVSSAATSFVALFAALLQKSRRPQGIVHVSIDGHDFEVKDVDPGDIDAVLAGVKKQVSKERPRALVEAGD